MAPLFPLEEDLFERPLASHLIALLSFPLEVSFFQSMKSAAKVNSSPI